MGKDNIARLELFLQEGEGYRVEYKESIKDIDRDLVAFANAAGGIILLGVSDKREVKGINITNRLKSQIQDIANNCQPKIDISFEEFKNILLIKIPEGKNKPYLSSKGFFLRVGPNSQKMARDEILQFATDEGIVRFDEVINPKFGFDDFDEEKFKDFLRRSNITVNLDIKDLLINLGLAEVSARKFFFKNVVILFFAKDLIRFHPSAYTSCLLHKNRDKSSIIDHKDFYGSLIEQFDNTVQFVERNTMLAYQIETLRRKEIPQYPLSVIREAIVNAIVHRDYFEHGSNVFVHVYRDLIEIINPGGLFKIKPEKFGKVSSRRNEKVAELFHMINLMEKAGTGIERMRDGMIKQGLKEPIFDFDENFFIAKFEGYSQKRLEEITEGEKIIKLNERQEKVLEYLKQKMKITTSEYTKLVNVSRSTAIRDLNKMVSLGLIKISGARVGKDRHYEL